MIEKINNYIIKNIVYIAVLSFIGISLSLTERNGIILNYISILLCVFIPAFGVANLYLVIKNFILNIKPKHKDLLVSFLLISLTIIIYIFGLKENQRFMMGIINAVDGAVIIALMYLFTNRKAVNKPV